MKFLLTPIAVLALFVSCNNPELGKGSLDLETIPMNFDVKGFYKKAIEKSDLKPLDTTANVKRQIADFINTDFVSVDTVDKVDFDNGHWGKNGRWVDNKGRVLGIQYNMISWDKTDSTARFQDLNFKRLNMMVTTDHDFMAVCASNDHADSILYHKTITSLTKKYGKPETKEKDFFNDYTSKTWKLEDRLIQFVSRTEKQQTDLNIKIGTDTTTHQKQAGPAFEIYLFVVNKKYQDNLRGSFNTGNWIYLK